MPGGRGVDLTPQRTRASPLGGQIIGGGRLNFLDIRHTWRDIRGARFGMAWGGGLEGFWPRQAGLKLGRPARSAGSVILPEEGVYRLRLERALFRIRHGGFGKERARETERRAEVALDVDDREGALRWDPGPKSAPHRPCRPPPSMWTKTESVRFSS